MAMLSIGELSRVTGLTIKTIRLYDEKGLLTPAVREDSGYRFYDATSVERARVIKQLRELEFSLVEIAQMLETGSDEADIVSFLERQQEVIANKLERYEEIHRALNTVITTERQANMAASTRTFSVEDKTVPAILVAGIRGKGVYSDSSERFGKLGRVVGRHINGKPLGLYFDAEYKEQDADFESCFPIRKAVSKDGIVVHELAGGRCISLVHRGPYAELGRSYQRVFEYIRANQLQSTTPSREVYLKGPGMIFKGNPKHYLTEIQVFVEETVAVTGSDPA
jgi:DNA-binding transcriptional MerR regulator